MKSMFYGMVRILGGTVFFGIGVLSFITVFSNDPTPWWGRLICMVAYVINSLCATLAIWEAGQYRVPETSETSNW